MQPPWNAAKHSRGEEMQEAGVDTLLGSLAVEGKARERPGGNYWVDGGSLKRSL